MLTSRWTHLGGESARGTKGGRKSRFTPTWPQNSSTNNRRKGKNERVCPWLPIFTWWLQFAFKALRNTKPVNLVPSKAHLWDDLLEASGNNLDSVSSFKPLSLQALLPIPCYLERQSHCHFEKGVKYYSLKSQAMGRNVPLRIPGYGDCARECAFSQSLSLILLSKSDSNFILFREKKRIGNSSLLQGL